MSDPRVVPSLTSAQQFLVERSRSHVGNIVGRAQKLFPRDAHADMEQGGWLACIDCARRYKPDMGVPFHGYFSKRVYGAAIEAGIAALYGRKLPPRLRAMRAAAEARMAAEDDAHGDAQDDPPRDLLADAPDPRDELERRAAAMAASLLSAATREASNQEGEADERARQEARRAALSQALGTLAPEERRAVQGMWLDERRAEDIAIDEGVHARSVRRYEARGLAKITAYVNALADEDL